MSGRTRHIFFRHHWWLVPTIGTASAFIIFKSNLPDKGTVFAAVVAAVLSVSFFAQQQRLEEMKLFRELIASFNDRYDNLNERLMRVRCEEGCSDYQAVWDYFNCVLKSSCFFQKGTSMREFGAHGALACWITLKLSLSLLFGERKEQAARITD